ncbi:MAG: beta-N-acetylhexosaminidase, partial [Chitinophagaceae bacterium]
MKLIVLFFVQFLFCVDAFTQASRLSLIPQPVFIKEGQGNFVLPATISIGATKDVELIKIQRMLGGVLSSATGKKVNYVLLQKSPGAHTILLSLVQDKSIPKEGYRLQVSATGVSLKATSPAGIFYGVQSLLQLLPKEIESKSMLKNTNWSLPLVTIEDHPRFGWRGVMLDVVRHWFTKEQVKDFIDDMVRFKFNMLHLHLSDDQGWRIEIKSLPRLTEVGAWRANRTGRWGDFTKPTADEPKNYGGFYTQEDMKELIQYAKERFVTIMPEIDVPGHSLAAVASYPELTCTTDSSYQVNAGERFMIWPGGGKFYGILDNTLCPANEKVYEFLDKVFTEIAALFPYEYIHMGGDECYKGYWE